MNKSFIKKIKESLKKRAKMIETELRGFATKDEALKGDWDTKFPSFNGASGGQQLEDEAGEVGEYLSNLPVEYSLELRLKNINLALEKIKKGTYGKCEKCQKTISNERLEIVPEARVCEKCVAR